MNNQKITIKIIEYQSIQLTLFTNLTFITIIFATYTTIASLISIMSVTHSLSSCALRQNFKCSLKT